MQDSAARSLSAAVATHVVQASFDELPPAAVHAARRALLDALGVMLAATGLSAEAAAYRGQDAEHARGGCRVLGSRDQCSAAKAAFANGALAHALDFGDCFDSGPAHPHAALVPALMAIADLRPSTQLGERYLGSEVSFKPWPACRGTHAYIEAALELRQFVDPAEIRSVSAGIGPIQQMLARPLPPWPAPISATEAKFSIPYAVSVAFADGKVDLGSFDQAHLGDERIRQFAARVEATEVAGWGREHAASGRLAVTLADGSRHEVEVLEALGAPGRPLSDEALVAKFVACCEHAADPHPVARSGELASLILHGRPEIAVSSLFDRLGSAA